MFGKKKPEDLTHSELMVITDALVDHDRLQQIISHGVSHMLRVDDYQEKLYNKIAAYVDETDIKQRVHNFMNSDAIKEIIDDHVKTKVAELLSQNTPIDEIIHERVDAAGIDQVIQWNNVAYGMLLSHINEVEKKTDIRIDMMKGLFAKDEHPPDKKVYRAKRNAF